jgi:hypothetical protein
LTEIEINVIDRYSSWNTEAASGKTKRIAFGARRLNFQSPKCFVQKTLTSSLVQRERFLLYDLYHFARQIKIVLLQA